MALHCLLFTASNSAFFTAQYSVITVYSDYEPLIPHCWPLTTAHSSLPASHTLHWTLFTIHCTPLSSHCLSSHFHHHHLSLRTAHSSLPHSLFSAQVTLRSLLEFLTLHYSLHILNSPLFTLHCSLIILDCLLITSHHLWDSFLCV